MKIHKNKKIKLKVIPISLLLSIILMIATTPIHEAGHWIMSDIDPYIEPVEINIFNIDSNPSNIKDHRLNSVLGYIIVREKYSNAFNERPIWSDTFQEIICILIQLTITIFISLKILTFLIAKYPKYLISTPTYKNN